MANLRRNRTFPHRAIPPDQPRIPGLALTYTNLVSLLMALAGILFLLWRYEIIRLPFLPNLPEVYKISTKTIS